MKIWLLWQVTREQIHSFEGEEIKVLIDIFKDRVNAEENKMILEQQAEEDGQDYYCEIEERKVV